MSPRILLFDPHAGGHHETYIRMVAEALAGKAIVVAAVSDGADLPSLGCDVFETVDESTSQSRRKSVACFRRAIVNSGADAAVHMFADRDIPILASGRSPGVPTSLLMFRPRSHYPLVFGNTLTPREKIVGLGIEASVALWIRRSRSNRVFTLDEFAAERWSSKLGARVTWWPEPAFPEPATSPPPREPDSVILFGSIAERKGVEALCRALLHCSSVKKVTFAGPVAEKFKAEFGRTVGLLQDRDIEVRVVDRWLSVETEASPMLAAAGVVAIPYPRHFGMSRVLLEAAAVGTPVVGTDFGLIGKQIKEFGLGRTVDIQDPSAFARALDKTIAEDPAGYAERGAEFANRYDKRVFEPTVARLLP